jgi:hypothetical protein
MHFTLQDNLRLRARYCVRVGRYVGNNGTDNLTGRVGFLWLFNPLSAGEVDHILTVHRNALA